MPHNKISEFLRDVKCINPLAAPLATDYADLADRLVEAARALMDDADEHDLLRDYVTVDRVLYEELTTALRDIELESEDHDARTN